MLLLVSVGQGGPVHDGEVNQPHVCVAQFLEEGLSKDQKVAGIFDGLAGVDNGGEYDDLEQFGAVGGRRAKSGLEVYRGRRRRGRLRTHVSTTEGARATSSKGGVFLESVLLLFTTGHRVGPRARGHKITSSVAVASTVCRAPTGSGEARWTDVAQGRKNTLLCLCLSLSSFPSLPTSLSLTM